MTAIARYWSLSKKAWVAIADMPTPHIANARKKLEAALADDALRPEVFAIYSDPLSVVAAMAAEIDRREHEAGMASGREQVEAAMDNPDEWFAPTETEEAP